MRSGPRLRSTVVPAVAAVDSMVMERSSSVRHAM
jgi:hypothetical protein